MEKGDCMHVHTLLVSVDTTGEELQCLSQTTTSIKFGTFCSDFLKRSHCIYEILNALMLWMFLKALSQLNLRVLVP